MEYLLGTQHGLSSLQVLFDLGLSGLRRDKKVNAAPSEFHG